MIKPKPLERLEKRLARVAREQGIDRERLRRWVSVPTTTTVRPDWDRLSSLP